MESVKQFLTKKLKLKVNEAKSAVAKPQERKFLGFSFLVRPGKEPKRRIAPKAVSRFKERVREITRKAKGVNTERMIEELSRYVRGWGGYFGFCETPAELENLDSWVRRRVRRAFWWQWKTRRNRLAELIRLGAKPDLAVRYRFRRTRTPGHLSSAHRPALVSSRLVHVAEGPAIAQRR